MPGLRGHLSHQIGGELDPPVLVEQCGQLARLALQVALRRLPSRRTTRGGERAVIESPGPAYDAPTNTTGDRRSTT